MADFVVSSRLLGSGAHATIHYARRRSTGEEVAVKVFKRPMASLPATLEINILRRLDHPHVISFMDSYVGDKQIFVFMPRMHGGCLFTLLTKVGPFSERHTHHFFVQILDALDYCHSKNVVHRDVKLENVLIERPNDDYMKLHLRLADFGLSAIQAKDGVFLYDKVGSPVYAPPEIIRGYPYFGHPADVWSLGVSLFLMATNYFPFNVANISTMFESILHDAPYFDLVGPLSLTLTDLIDQMLKKPPGLRPTIDVIREHPWYKGEHQ